MEYNISQIDSNYDFIVRGASFIGNPRNNTILFVTAKVKKLLANLNGCEECLVFAEEGIEIPELLKARNCFIMAKDPQLEYANLAVEIEKEEKIKDKAKKYSLTEGGYYIGENVSLGKNSYIEPNCLIGHDVVIGDNAHIGFGSTIKNAVIGNDFSCNDYTCVGTDAFFMAEGERKFRIPSFGKVIIEDNVDLSCSVIIERGFNSDTVIGQNTKIDSAVVIGHDVCLGENVVITCGANIAGLVNVGNDTFIGMNATIKQRLNIGEKAMIGMGSAVMTKVKDNVSVLGNPAHKFGL